MSLPGAVYKRFRDALGAEPLFRGGLDMEFGDERRQPNHCTVAFPSQMPEYSFGPQADDPENEDDGIAVDTLRFVLTLYASDTVALEQMVKLARKAYRPQFASDDPSERYVVCLMAEPGVARSKLPYSGRQGEYLYSAAMHYTAEFTQPE